MTNEEAIKFGKEQLEIFGEDSQMSEFIRLAIEALEERPKGKWLEWVDERWGGVWHYCSNCHSEASYKEIDRIFKQILSDFCPNCGADMRGDV